MPQTTRTYAAPDSCSNPDGHAPLALEEAVILGTNVERLRTRLGLGITGFSVRAGISRPFIYKVESGLANPKLSDMRKLADALGVTVPDLLTPPPEPTPKALPANL